MTAMQDSSRPDDADDYETYLLKLRLSRVYHCQCGKTFPGHSYAFVKEHIELTRHRVVQGGDANA